jgi:hypothetical protein
MEEQPAQRLWSSLRTVDILLVLWALIFIYCILLPTFFVLDSSERKQKWLNNITSVVLERLERNVVERLEQSDMEAAPDLKASTNASTSV